MPTMQYDVLATKPLTSTGPFKDQLDNNIQRARIKTIYAINGTDPGSVVIREGGASGQILATINTAANTTAGYTIIPMPGEGILCQTGLHGTVTNTTSMTLIKKSMACNKPKATPSHPKKSHVVKACESGREKIIRFGEQGKKVGTVSGTAGKPKSGESDTMEEGLKFSDLGLSDPVPIDQVK